MMNNIYADTAKEVLSFLGVAGAKMCEPICKAIVDCKCSRTEAAVAAIKEVTKDMTVFSQISDQFFTAYRKSLELIEKTHQTTVEAYMIVIANDNSLTFAEKVNALMEMQRESNQASMNFHKIIVGSVVLGMLILGGTYVYGKHCNTVVSLAKMSVKRDIADAASPFAGINEILFAVAEKLRKR